MWYFDSPHVIFGEEALSHLAQLSGRHAFIDHRSQHRAAWVWRSW